MRKKWLFLLSVFFVYQFTIAQQDIRKARQESWQSFVYKIPADTAEKYIQKWDINPDQYLLQTPFAIWQNQTEHYELLPAGNYVIIAVQKNELVTSYYCKSNIRMMPVNNQSTLQFELRDSVGNTGVQADMWMNGKKLKYNLHSKTFTSNKRRADEATIKVVAAGDTSFFELTELENFTKSRWSQWWSNLYHRDPIYKIAAPVRFVKMLITTQPAYWFKKRRYRSTNNGYVIFNQPKYKPGDTLRLKAYIINRKGKPYSKNVDLSLGYYTNGKYFSKQLATVAAISPGAYVYDFVLGDSLDADRNYQVYFNNKKANTLLSGSFNIEDYLLDEVATYSFRPEKESYYQNDTLLFYANAKDANGLALMDGRARLYLISKRIRSFYQKQVLVPDTLWQQEKPLVVEGDTKFEVPAALLPDADLDIEATIEFRNSNNEIQEKEVELSVIKNRVVLKARQQENYVIAEYLQNGVSVPAKGKMSYDGNDIERDIQFPFKEKINPFTEEYSFWIENEKSEITANDYIEVEKTADVVFSRVQSKDSAGFSLHNPLKAQVNYSLFYGNNVIMAGSDTAENIVWLDRLPEKKIYTLVWNYIWGGKEYKGNSSVALLSKLLGAAIKGAETIYPGQTDTITVSVTDYKGKPAPDVNLTAVSYNSQFSKDIKVPEPPYGQRYRYRSRLLMDEYESEQVGFTSRKLVGDHQQWRNVFGLDSMLYYKFLFPPGGKFVSSKYIGDFVPQLAIHAVQKGVPQEIYLLYINRRLVWYNGVTDSSRYAFTTPPGYMQIGLRLKNKYIEIDSVYAQPYYKHDIIFDLDQLPSTAKVTVMEDRYDHSEQTQLERQLFRIQNDGKTNGGYVWQSDRLVQLTANSPHVVGPFEWSDSLQFFKPDNFDLKFALESGYEYKLTPKMARLERKPLFTGKDAGKLPIVKKNNWMLGDTIPALPVIEYITKYTPPYLFANDYYYTKSDSAGTITIELPADSNFIHAVLYSVHSDTRIKSYQLSRFENVKPGNYNLVLVTKNLYFLEVENVKVAAHTTTCIKSPEPSYTQHNFFVESLHLSQLNSPRKIPVQKTVKDTTYTPVITGLPLPKGNAAIEGVVKDKDGTSPIPGVTVVIRGYNSGAVTNEKGYFRIGSIRAGVYNIIISTVGYATRTVQVTLEDNVTKVENIELKPMENALDEVIVTGFGISKKRALTYAATAVREEVFTALQGRAAGVVVTNHPGNASSIIIRGASSLTDNTKPLYVVNGVLMDELPAGMELEKMQVNVLKGEMAVSLYGNRAANGVIVINTDDFTPKTLRENFKDYAIWQPNLITNKEGKVQFVTTYPDNITSWQTFVVGMDKKRRITKTSTIVKSFKPILAQSSVPQFLIEGDSAIATGKLLNYTTTAVDVQSSFTINDSISQKTTHQLRAKESVTERLPITATSDSVKALYNLKLDNGYADGELRKIPVYKKGTEEAKGIFHIINADTSFTYVPESRAAKTVLYFQDNPIDVLLDELKYLKEYPYFCMEQTASKLTGLLLEKQTRKNLQQPFDGEKQVQQLLSKLQKAQLFNGGWSWWQNGEANLAITNYVTRTLLLVKDDALVQTNIRNATLYLQNILPRLKEHELLDALYTMSEAGHIMDYSAYLQKIQFDSLTIHQQWLVVAIKQKQQMAHNKEWNVVMSKKIETMLGGMHWGEDSYWWERNEVATTVLAYTILQRKQGQQEYLQKIVQYFLERRKNGRWRNTVESASICAAILPMVLQQQPKYNTKPVVTISAGQTITVDKFPYVTSINNYSGAITIAKQGGGMMYVTAWQKTFNANPQPVTNNFIINSRFEKNGRPVAALQAGEKATLKVTVHALKDAEYVLIEIPIPAGCTYADKPQGWNTHKEFLKDKLVIFVQQMQKGKYEYAIELEPRYSGMYHLNPVRAELMYFATFYGRNEMKQVEIAPETQTEIKK